MWTLHSRRDRRSEVNKKNKDQRKILKKCSFIVQKLLKCNFIGGCFTFSWLNVREPWH